jgi:hypothetical protein
MTSPWTLHEAELALWPAWQDGFPFHGPGNGRDAPSPLLSCKASLSISASFDNLPSPAQNWTAAPMVRAASYQIAIAFPDGVLADAAGRLMAGIHPGGYRILTVRFFDESSQAWTLWSFYHVTPSADATADSAERMVRTLTLDSKWRQERVGQGSMPSLYPTVLGEVDWICGTQCIHAMTYDPATETWSSTPRNATGDGSRYVTISPLNEDEGSDVIIAAYLPRIAPAATSGDLLPRAAVNWQNTIAMKIGGHSAETHHGLTLQAGHTLQAIGIAEPLVRLPQSRVIDEPVVVFRYLRRVYATLGHGVFAVPRLNVQAPPVTHDPAFRIAPTGPANPATGHSGIVLLPNGAWLDGTLLTNP